MDSYDELRFAGRIDAALKTIKTVLENTRNPQVPADVPHRYDDKYLLVEFVAGTTIASLFGCLEAIGLTREDFARLREWTKTRSVTLRLDARESCHYLREDVRKVEPTTETVRETTSGTSKKVTTEKVIQRITEHFWGFDFEYRLVAFQGNTPENAITITSRKGSTEIKTSAKTTPRPKETAKPSRDVNVTWLLAHLDAESRASFSIDRTKAATPRRNDQVDEAMTALEELYAWCAGVRQYFSNDLFAAQADHGRDLSAIDDAQVFVPVVPLLEENADPKLPASNMNDFLAEERRSLAEKRKALAIVFPTDSSIITSVEAQLLVTLMHAMRVCQHFSDGVDYVEGMLRKQLIAAIGKEVGPADFSSYMEFHQRKLLKPEYRPQPFSYAIRRPDHYPEGVLSIEAHHGGDMSDPIFTTVTHTMAKKPMSFALDAATRVSFLGNRYLHAWISHQFSGQETLALALMARARQFSSFIVLVGRIVSADVFEPKHGIIVQNKDLVAIPLMLEQIPTPKEFRDAVESLSPEQQRFAKAFRSMKLESTLFGICVIQIKPQLEKLLKLPPDSLTKEIKMTQELLDLFIEYQIPSDLIAYAGPEDAPPEEKIAKVKDYAAKMQEMIELSKKKQLDEEREREAFRLAQMNRTPVYPASAVAGGMPMPPPQMAPMPVMRSGTGAPPPHALEDSYEDEMSVVDLLEPQASVMDPSETTETETPATQPQQHASTKGSGNEADPDDYTRVPGQLDTKLEELDTDGALRATIINPADTWMRRSQKGLLGAPEENELYEDEQKTEKNRAFDLLDALTRSGSLSVDEASLHVVLAATHCFDQTLIDTVIRENVNPIEKVERSLLIVGTTIHKLPATELLSPEQRDRFFTTSPQLGPGKT